MFQVGSFIKLGKNYDSSIMYLIQLIIKGLSDEENAIVEGDSSSWKKIGGAEMVSYFNISYPRWFRGENTDIKVSKANFWGADLRH